MKDSIRKKDNPKALETECPYCGAKAGEDCRVVRACSVYTLNSTPRDQWGQTLVHKSRIKAATVLEGAA